MARVDWILKPTGHDQMGDVISHLGGVRAELRHTANTLAAIARGNLLMRRDSGDSRITVTRGDKLDYFVNLDDTRGQLAAAAIEYGNKYGGGGAAPLRDAIGSMRFAHLKG